MELKELFPLYRRWIWLLALGLILGLGAGYLASKIQTPIYEVSTKVLVTRTRQQGVTDILAMSDQQLVLTYLQLLKTRPVLDEASSRLGIKINRDSVNVEIISDTQIIQIKVQDKNPDQAASIANTLVQILIEKNETLQAGRYTAYEEGLDAQIAQVQKQIDALQGQITQINQANIQEQLDLVNKQITDLQAEISTLESDISKFPAILSTVDRASLTEKQTRLDQLRSLLYLYQQIQTNLTFIGKPVQGGSGSDDPRVTSLQSTLNLYQQLYLNLLNNITTVKLARVQSTPTVSPIEDASIPERPVRPIPLLYTLLSGIVGLILAGGAVVMIDYFDDTLKSAQKVREVLDLPVIGQIAEATQTHKSGGALYAFNQTGSILSNAFGSLRINVSRLMEQAPTKTILITSPGLGEGKTTISLNLAATFVRSGKKVVLLDADFYHPQVHARLGLNNEKGLASILDDDVDWQVVARDFGGINVITSGSDSPSSSALLETEHMPALLEKLNKEADLVIVDGPPLSVVDSQVLASQVGGILLVIRQGSTITEVARAMLDQLKLMEVNVLGTVLNRIPRADAYYFNGYHRYIPAQKPLQNLEKVEADHS